MAKPRLYDGPTVTEEVLRLVIKGTDTQQSLAEELGCAEQTVYNKIHDAKSLGFLIRDNGHYIITDEKDLLGFFQLGNKGILKERFEKLPGVEEVNDKLVGGCLSLRDVGGIISYYTDSRAITDDTFVTYGRVYAKWFEYLGMGYQMNGSLYREKPEEYKKKSGISRTYVGFPKVRPNRVLEALPILESTRDPCKRLASHFEISERESRKILSTCYFLGLAKRNKGVILTDFGERVLNASTQQRKDLLRNALLESDIVDTYYNLAPDRPFNNQDLMELVNERLNMNWSPTTRQTKAKRLYQWLLYTELFDEVKNGTLIRVDS